MLAHSRAESLVSRGPSDGRVPSVVEETSTLPSVLHVPQAGNAWQPAFPPRALAGAASSPVGTRGWQGQERVRAAVPWPGSRPG